MAKAVLSAALLVCSLGSALIATGALADDEQPEQRHELALNAVWKGDGRVHGLFHARQGGGHAGIIAILIGLKADRRYTLGFSRNDCRHGRTGRVSTRIGFTADGAGRAVVTESVAARAADVDGADFLVWARSVVVLGPRPARGPQRCARLDRVAGGDTSGDGIPGDESRDITVTVPPLGKGGTQGRRLMANAALDPRGASAIRGLVLGEATVGRRQGRRGRAAALGFGGRPAPGIIAILIGLRADQRYGLGFSRNDCEQGRGGLLRRPVPVRGGAQGHAVARDKATPKLQVLMARARSVVVVTPRTGGRFHACGRLDYSIGGDADRPTEELAF